MKTTLTKTELYEVLLDDSGQDLLRLTLTELNGGLRIGISHNGVMHNAYVAKAKMDGTAFIKKQSVANLVDLLDSFSTLFNTLSPEPLLEQLNARLDAQLEAGEIEASEEEDLRAQILQTTVAFSLPVLHNTFGALLVKLYGQNWVAMHSGDFVGKSEQYKALIKRVEICKQAVSDEAGS